eukprot:5069620-Prymnesium_polylepis.2
MRQHTARAHETPQIAPTKRYWTRRAVPFDARWCGEAHQGHAIAHTASSPHPDVARPTATPHASSGRTRR